MPLNSQPARRHTRHAHPAGFFHAVMAVDQVVSARSNFRYDDRNGNINRIQVRIDDSPLLGKITLRHTLSLFISFHFKQFKNYSPNSTPSIVLRMVGQIRTEE